MNNFLKRPIAHRGLFDNINIVENTLASFNNAIDNDYAIELDVVMSKDHEAVVFHDYDLKRLANKNLQIFLSYFFGQNEPLIQHPCK